MTALLLLCILAFAALPAPYVAAAWPAIWLTQGTALGPRAVLFNAGIPVTAADLVLLTLLGKLALSAIGRRELVIDRALYVAFAAYLVVNLLATLASGVKFADAPVFRGISALLRLASEFALVPILAQTVTSLAVARRCAGIVLGTLGILALIQFVNFFGASHGIIIGEVQGIERGEVRYFGPVGDSVGSVLLLGYLYSLCASSVVGAGVFLGGIVLTAGLGAVFSAGIGTVVFLFFGLRASAARAFFARYFWLLPVLAFAGAVGVVVAGPALSKTLIERVAGGGYAASASQRVASGSLAVKMIEENPLSGVGFMGYESALARYGGDREFDLNHPDGATGNANNQFLQTLADAGVPGLLVFGTLMLFAARLLRDLGAQGDDRFLATFFLGAYVWLLAQILGNQAAVWLVPGSYVARFLWIVLGVGVAVARLLPEARSQTAAEVSADHSRVSLVTI